MDRAARHRGRFGALLLAALALAGLPPARAAVQVGPPDTTARHGTRIAVPVRLTGLEGQPVVAVEAAVSFPPGQVHLDTLWFGGGLLDGWLVDAQANLDSLTSYLDTVVVSGERDTVELAGATVSDTLFGDGVLFWAGFTVSDARDTLTIPLGMDHVLLNAGVPAAQGRGGSIRITGVDGVLQVLPELLARSQDLQVTVADADEDRTAQVDSVTATAVFGTDAETLRLYETGPASGLFAGALAAVFDSLAVPGDGVLQVVLEHPVVPGQQIRVCHGDLLDSQGMVSARCDSVEVDAGNLGELHTSVVAGPGDTVLIRLSDPDLDSGPEVADTVCVLVANLDIPGEQEVVTLTEGTEPHVLWGLALPVHGTGVGTPGDSALNVQRGDSLLVTYLDAATGLGDPLPVRDTCVVVDPWGDASANGKTGSLDAALILAHSVGLDTLVGLDSLSANVTAGAPFDSIMAYDASLVLQWRVGIISRFPVQATTSANHALPAPVPPSPRPAAAPLALVPADGYLAVTAGERDGILAGDLELEGLTGLVELAVGLEGFMVATRRAGAITRIAFAGSVPLPSGPGELLRLYPGPGDQVRVLWATWNGSIRAAPSPQVAPAPRPAGVWLAPNAPNPFNPETRIQYALPRRAPAVLEVYDAAGQRVRAWVLGEQPAGTHTVVWDGRNDAGEGVAAGVYLCRLTAAGRQAVQRMVLVK
ncbi:MAG: FlgD immunoglobulin-like domain containing protein [Candidatus Latescibacterota bacterium]